LPVGYSGSAASLLHLKDPLDRFGFVDLQQIVPLK
jgi:hypothetical protein